MDDACEYEYEYEYECGYEEEDSDDDGDVVELVPGTFLIVTKENKAARGRQELNVSPGDILVFLDIGNGAWALVEDMCGQVCHVCRLRTAG